MLEARRISKCPKAMFFNMRKSLNLYKLYGRFINDGRDERESSIILQINH